MADTKSTGTVLSQAEISERLQEPFPADAIEEKNSMLYLPHEVVRERLIWATGNHFHWTIDQVLFRDDGVTRRPADRQTGEVRRPQSMIVIGTLMIPGMGSRAGIGAHPIDEGSGEDAAYKSAESDALKRAAMAFGVGLAQMYIEVGQAKRNPRGRQQNQPRQDRAPRAPSNGTLSDKQFQEQVTAAMQNHDADTFRKLVDEGAGEHIGRWVALLQAAESPQALDWIRRQLERKGIKHQVLDNEISRVEHRLAATVK